MPALLLALGVAVTLAAGLLMIKVNIPGPNADPGMLEPRFRAALMAGFQDAAAAGVNLYIIEGKRSPERQAALWAQGRDLASGEVLDRTRVVTWTLSSRHLVGEAADLGVRGAAPGSKAWVDGIQKARPYLKSRGLVSLVEAHPETNDLGHFQWK